MQIMPDAAQTHNRELRYLTAWRHPIYANLLASNFRWYDNLQAGEHGEQPHQPLASCRRRKRSKVPRVQGYSAREAVGHLQWHRLSTRAFPEGGMGPSRTTSTGNCWMRSAAIGNPATTNEDVPSARATRKSTSVTAVSSP